MTARPYALVRARILRHAPRLFVRLYTPDARELGELGEELAVRALLRAGCEILGRRVRTRFAEVDIVALEGRTLVCVEVKTARVAPIPIPRGSGLDPLPPPFRRGGRLGAKQTARLLRAARELARKPPRAARVDLVEVTWNTRSNDFDVTHSRGSCADPETRSGSQPRGAGFAD
ncbi:MAG: YraN family protein [Planctomycetes bacterium]|nr:YraN family protein [Planctomycetota bacterium]